MQTQVCPDCGNTVDARARVCPRCKGRLRPKIGVLGKLAIVVVALVIIGVGAIVLMPHAGL